MSLDKVFGKAEKVEEEKSLETIQLDEAVSKEVLALFESKVFKFHNNSWTEIFDEYKKSLGSFKVTTGAISKFDELSSKRKELKWMFDHYKGIFLSALMQTSYEQGNNNFEFEEVKGRLQFGSYLKGNKNNPIKIQVKKLEGGLHFNESADFCVQINELKGDKGYPWYSWVRECTASFWNAHSFLAKIQDIKGYENFMGIGCSTLEIGSYEGLRLCYGMENCKVYSPNIYTYTKLKLQKKYGKSNQFIFGHIPKELAKWDF